MGISFYARTNFETTKEEGEAIDQEEGEAIDQEADS